MSGLVDVLLLIALIVIVGVLTFTFTADQRTTYRNGAYNVNCNSTGYEGCGAIAGYNATVSSDAGAYKIFSNLSLLGLAAAFGVVLYIILRVIPKTSGGF